MSSPNDRQRERLTEFFEKADKDKSGCLSPLELAQVVRDSGFDASPAEIVEWFQEIDKNKDGSVKLDEFLAYMDKKPSSEVNDADLTCLFKEMDKDGSGFLSPSELQTALAENGYNVTAEQAQNIVKHADVNGDGQIGLDEMLKAWHESS